jgi:hypothetical protein
MTQHWTAEDARNNLCSYAQVGTKKPDELSGIEPPADHDQRPIDELMALLEQQTSKGAKLPEFKEALLKAYYLLGGVRALVAWGRASPGKFYPLMGKLLPQEFQLALMGEATIYVRHALPPPVGRRLPSGDNVTIEYQQPDVAKMEPDEVVAMLRTMDPAKLRGVMEQLREYLAAVPGKLSDIDPDRRGRNARPKRR